MQHDLNIFKGKILGSICVFLEKR